MLSEFCRTSFFVLCHWISGVMRLEATKFRPREVVRHVLQTAAASLKKMLTLEGYIADDVPIEVEHFSHVIQSLLCNYFYQ